MLEKRAFCLIIQEIRAFFVQNGQNERWTEQKLSAFLQTLSMKRFLTFSLLAFALGSHAETTQKKAVNLSQETIKEGPSKDGLPVAAVSTIEVEDLAGFGLTKLNLTYSFGSADPKKGGMDCSGTIYYVLHEFGFKGVPRQSNEMAGWVRDKTLLHRVNEAEALSHAEFSFLQPGNLLFWTGTYETAPRKIPVTHVMLYLGKLKKNGKHVVFGASDGRAYQGQRRTGVSVFDFTLPKSTSTATFYGYGMIPGVGKIEAKPKPEKPAVIAKVKPTPAEPMVAAVKAPDPVPQKVVIVTKNEEVRPAIPVANKTDLVPSPTMAKAKEPVVKTEPATPDTLTEAKPEPTKVSNTTAKPKTVTQTKSSAPKSKPVVRKRPPPPPPSTMDRVKQATASFLNDVRRKLPK